MELFDICNNIYSKVSLIICYAIVKETIVRFGHLWPK